MKSTGELLLSTPIGEFIDGAPFAYQGSKECQEEVAMRYAVRQIKEDGARIITFDIGDYDQNEMLVLDPMMYCYCGYIGGSDDDNMTDIAVDGKGGIYVAGSTISSEATFPVKTGPDLTFNDLYFPGGDAFVGKLLYWTLDADAETLSESTGGSIHFTLDAGAHNALRDYIMLGSINGTAPGGPLPGGMAVLPINRDLFTGIVITAINTPIFSYFLGKLDAAGKGKAAFDTLGPMPPGFVGTVIHFAYALNAPRDFASNPASIEIVP